MNRVAFTGADIFDGHTLHTNSAAIVAGGILEAIVAEHEVPRDVVDRRLPEGTIMPGFVDLQVNGGGGVLFNDVTSVEGIATIATAHASTGTRGFLPTLITDTPERTRLAVDAVEAAIEAGVPGILGIHLEGPHLSVARKGAHDPDLIRRMEDSDEAFLLKAAERLPNVLVTVARESVSDDQISRLANAGVIVSLGHSDCSFAEAVAATKAGVRCVTHLFNAMSQLHSREPGLAGVALSAGAVSAGLIADGIHVHPGAIQIALAAKVGPGQIFLVTDAMPTVGSDISEFTLNGRRVLRRNGRLTLEDGTLAGADLDMPTALKVMTELVGVAPAEAFAMATSRPADVLLNPMQQGTLRVGSRWSAIHLDRASKPRPLPAD